MENPLEIYDIGVVLKSLGSCSAAFPQRTVAACNQAAFLLERMREVILSRVSNNQIVEELREILAKQGEG